jgi:hypothetical protein
MRRWKRGPTSGGTPKRQKPRKLEDPIHILCFNWLDANIEGMVFHTPNGLDGGSEVVFIRGKPVPRAAIMWNKLVKLGARAGILDLTIHWAEGDIGRTAYFEIKSEDGTLSKGQKDFIADLDRCKIPHAVCRSLADCTAAVAALRIPLKKFICAPRGQCATLAER